MEISEKEARRFTDFLWKYAGDQDRSEEDIFAKRGVLQEVQWLYELGYEVFNYWIFSYVASEGHLEIAKWLKKMNCHCGYSALQWAAYAGHLKMVEWLIQIDYPMNVGIMNSAAEGGQLEVMKMLKALSCPMNSMTMQTACYQGYEEMADWLRENGCPK